MFTLAPMRTYTAAARRLSRGAALDPLGAKARSAHNQTLHPFMAADFPGLPWPASLAGDKPLFQGARECGVVNIQPGGGKTSGFVIPQADAAPAGLVFTGNKADGVKEITQIRSGPGRTVYEIDPMNILGHGQHCYFNPLDYVHDDVTANELAKIIADADQANNTRNSGQAGEDRQFGPAGRNLLAAALLGAALTGRNLAMVHKWIVIRGKDPDQDRTHEGELIIRALRDQQWTSMADSVEALRSLPERTRMSVWATCDRMVQDLAYRHNQAWTTPTKNLHGINLDHFLTSRDTLMLISAKGTGGAGFIVMAIIHFLRKRAEKLAGASGGRLPLPLVMLLDEVCNIVAWPSLPDDLSYFGSLGIMTNLFFQGFDQGTRVFGTDGMKQIIKTANMRWIGGGEDANVARDYSATIGDYEKKVRSSQRRGLIETGHSTTLQTRPILTPSQIANMPKGLGLLYAQELPGPCLGKIIGWHERNHTPPVDVQSTETSRKDSLWTS